MVTGHQSPVTSRDTFGPDVAFGELLLHRGPKAIEASALPERKGGVFARVIHHVRFEREQGAHTIA